MNNENYIQACIDGICRDITEARSGDRNSTFNRKAYRLFQAVGAGQLTEDHATNELTVCGEFIELSAQEIRDTLKSAKRGMAEPKPLGNLQGVLTSEVKAQAEQLKYEQDSEALAKQSKSLSWLSNIESNSAENSPYLKRKKLTDYHQYFFSGEDKKGRFTAHKLYGSDGAVCGFERIYDDGSKMVSAGSGASGVYLGSFVSGEMDDSLCYVVEGAADALSIVAATGKDCYSATSSVNIGKIADLVSAEYERVIVCLDHDEAGRKTADKLKAKYKCVMPEKEGDDFNDVFVAGGVDAVIKQLSNEFKPRNDAVLSFEQFALTNFEEMRGMLENDNWVLDRIALEGQITLLFAQPNSGKTLLTLKLLIDSVKSGDIDGKSVFYINSDDTLRGLTTKAEIAAKYGINMLASGFNGFKNEQLAVLLEQLTDRDEAKGKIVVLDTLKKFSDLMSKNDSAAFNEIMRAFVAKGGTVIALAHVNKSRDVDGKLIYQGTSDSVDDADCAYTIDVVNVSDDKFQGTRMTTRTVMFENFKARGDNIDKVSYQYTKIDGEPYIALLESVKPVDEIEALRAEKQGRISEKLSEHEEEIQLVLDALEAGTNTTEKLIGFLMAEGVSRAKARKVLKAHCGDDVSEGHKWQIHKGEKNERVYKALF